MSFNYDVLDENEAQKAREFPLLPDGIYDFAVVENKFQYSQSGNPMIGLKLRIIHEGKEFNVFDNLIGIKSMIWKTKHFCETTGLEAEYLAGSFNEHLAANKRGACKIITKPQRPKNDGSGEFYKPKNEVEDYLSGDALVPQQNANPFAPPPAKESAKAPEVDDFGDKDIPF